MGAAALTLLLSSPALSLACVRSGMLFIVGFGSSMVFGTVVGSAADKYGRKKLCLVFGLLYSLSCLTKHIKHFQVLMIGRLLGGISTSILFSSFESWMVHVRRRRAQQRNPTRAHASSAPSAGCSRRLFLIVWLFPCHSVLSCARFC